MAPKPYEALTVRRDQGSGRATSFIDGAEDARRRGEALARLDRDPEFAMTVARLVESYQLQAAERHAEEQRKARVAVRGHSIMSSNDDTENAA